MDSFKQHLADFEPWFKARITELGSHDALSAAIADGTNGGKRFRAVLVFAATQLSGASVSSGYPMAAAVEMIHAYSLIHDDLPALDNADLRRGQPTIHKKHGEAMAILAGDGLLTDAFAVLAQLDAPATAVVNAISGLAAAAGSQGMVGGQVGDILDLGSADSVDTVRQIHRLKTGALIEWSILTPPTIWAPEFVDLLTSYAEHIGILFQVRDDLLDIDPNATSDKDRGADGSKSTYAQLLGADGAKAHAQEHLDACLESASNLPEPHRHYFSELARWTSGRLT